MNPNDSSFAMCSSSSTAPGDLLVYSKADSVETTTSGTNRLPTIEELRGKDNLPASKLPFLIKLHTLLDDVEKTGNDHIISWLSHGLSFKVHRPQALMKVLAPLYFNQTKWKSFQRQLHLYEFARTPYGLEAGSYSHPNFVRGQPDLCLCLRPIKIKGQKKGEGRKVRLPVVFTPPPPPQQQQQHQPAEVVRAEMEMMAPTIPRDNLDGKVSPAVDSAEHARWVAKIKSLVVNGASLAAQLQQEKSSSSSSFSQASHLQQEYHQQQPMFQEEAVQYPTVKQQQQQQQESFLAPTSVGSSGNNASVSSKTIPPRYEQQLIDDDTMMFCQPVEREGSRCVAFGARSFNFLPLGHDVNRCDCCYSGDEGGADDDDDDDDDGDDRFYKDDENISSALKLPANDDGDNINIGSSSGANADDDDEDFVQQILAAVE